MKTFSVAVAVAVVLTFICFLESSAVPATEVEELDDPITYDFPAAEHEDTSVDSLNMPEINQRGRRRRKCVFCCNCCRIGCGVCCSRRF